MARFFILLSLACLSLAATGLHAQGLFLERPSPAKPQKTGVLRAPEFDKSEAALAYFKLKNNWKETAAPDFLTFGQAFRAGALFPGDTIGARFGDKILAAQMDVKALHNDGSVRHAAITIATPPLKSGKTTDGALIKDVEIHQRDFAAAGLVRENYKFPISLTFHFSDQMTADFFIDARSLIIDAIDNGQAPGWLKGPLVKEYRIETEAAPHLRLQFDIRIYRDGDIRTSVGLANQKTFASGIRNMIYDVVIGPKENPAFAAREIGHHRASNWRRIFWTGAQPQLHIVHDLQGLAQSGAVAPFDLSLGVIADAIAARDAILQNLPPLSPALVERYMPMAGGRPDLGLYPQWTAHYMVTQTEAAKRVMLANAEAAGAVPWHFTDDATGAPISIETRPKFWADERGLEPQYAPDRPHPDLFASSDGGWSPDHSHKPALVAVPYLVTADHHYADELAMQAAWAIFGRWPDLREGGLKAIDVEQVRASAWSLRDLSDAAFLLPDAHPSKNYLKRALEQNLTAMRKKYVDAGYFREAGALEGFFEEYIDREPERISPWQNDYMALALWLAANRGNGDARALLLWSENFHSQRFLNPDFDQAFAAAYTFPAKDAATQKPVANWAALAAKLHDQFGAPDMQMQGYPELGYGYVASAYAALTAIASATGAPRAYEALARLAKISRDDALWAPFAKGGVRRHNQFLFSIVMPDGAVLSRNNLRFGKSGGDKNDFIVGGGYGDKISGRGGADALFGFDGADALDGGPGADFLSGGPGDDDLTGGSGRDIFSFQVGETGHDRISDFDPAQDQIRLQVKGFANAAEILESIKMTPQGARLDLAHGDGSIMLENVDVSLLKTSNFHLFQ